MITRNGQILFGVTLFGRGPTTTTPTSGLTFLDTTNTECYFNNTGKVLESAYINKVVTDNLDITTVPTSSSNSCGLIVWVGSNDNNTVLDESNIDLDTPLTNQQIVCSDLKLLYASNGGVVVQGNLTNIGNDDLSIKEIGLYGKTKEFVSSSTTNKIILIGRNIIDEYILKPYDNINLSFNINFN